MSGQPARGNVTLYMDVETFEFHVYVYLYKIFVCNLRICPCARCDGPFYCLKLYLTHSLI